MEELVYTKNGWNEWSKYVLMTIDKITKDVKKLEEQTVLNRDELLEKITELNNNIIKLNTENRFKNRITTIIVSLISAVLSGSIVGVLLTFLI